MTPEYKALLQEHKGLKQREAELVKDLDKDWTKYAQDLNTKLFTRWHVARDWLKNVQETANQTYVAVSPFGRVRHLWGYLHFDEAVYAAMSRRGPNSIIQGYASDLGAVAARIFTSLAYKFRGDDNGILHHNTVHDALECSAYIEEIPFEVYLQEHAMTTQVAKFSRTTFNHQLLSALDIDMDIGCSMGHMSNWNMRYDSLPDIIKEQLDWGAENLDRHYDVEAYMCVIKHNCKIMAMVRRAELLEAVKHDLPAEKMLITSRKQLNSLGIVWSVKKLGRRSDGQYFIPKKYRIMAARAKARLAK